MNTPTFLITGQNFARMYEELPPFIYMAFSTSKKYVALGYCDYVTHIIEYTPHYAMIISILQNADITKLVPYYDNKDKSFKNMISLTEYLLDHHGIHNIPQAKDNLEFIEKISDELLQLKATIDVLKSYVETHIEPQPLIDKVDGLREKSLDLVTMINIILADHEKMEINQLIENLKKFPQFKMYNLQESIIGLIGKKYFFIRNRYISLY